MRTGTSYWLTNQREWRSIRLQGITAIPPVNGLMYHCKDQLSGINGVMRPGIVHRIDMDTTGVA